MKRRNVATEPNEIRVYGIAFMTLTIRFATSPALCMPPPYLQVSNFIINYKELYVKAISKPFGANSKPL